ncbi:conserved Plasmodium protein, unknown function [Plasmodium gallinaceum]|uniref:Alpha/beta hydrolase n=1 Tax=Plasmodium gallinaceum TaxID=5849 RepID=A0A1J1GNM1_PLAGA|nr:conserved Plasmodium protein, unknown function [Plasmodium gallinaceum]CRG93878.1 conserved Plasmodium protein, unknown function [Plasmodium gallinaceum]
MENEIIYKENDIVKNKNKRTGIKGVTRKCLDLIDVKCNNLTNLINKNHSSEVLTNYQFSDDEIKFYSDENSPKDMYSPESSYTNDDFKNLLGWIPRNLKIVEPTSTDSIPCAFFFSDNNKSIKNDKIILYLHKFNEDLGTTIPTVYALHKELNINIIAMEYSGYGVSFDNYEQKLVSIVNDSFTILKFIVNFLKIPYNNIYILCYEFLASCAIEVVNRFEYTYGKNIPFGGIIIIKPQFLEIINSSEYKNDDITIKGNSCDNSLKSNNLIDRTSYQSREEDVIIHEESENEQDSSNTLFKKKRSKMNFKKSSQTNSYMKKEKKKNKMKNCSENEGKMHEQNKQEKNQERKKKNFEKINLNKKGSIFNNQIVYKDILSTNYHAYNGIITCDMSLFYSNSEYKMTENNIPYLLMKRILKDTFDINHVKNSIKSISCSILIFHPENYSYRNSCSHILLTSANQCFKKAAFSFDFMNEDFVTAFKWFFSENCDPQKKEKLFKNLLYLYIHPKYDNTEYNKKDIIDDTNNNINNDFEKDFSNCLNSNLNDFHKSSNSYLNNNDNDYDKGKDNYNNENTINIPNEIFICPEISVKLHN